MPWQVTIDPSMPVVETGYSGILSPAELMAAAQETMDQARAHGIRLFLGDCTELLGGHSVFDLCRLAETISGGDVSGIEKEAVLLPLLTTQKMDVEFWETACRNRGLQVKVFSDRALALNWLLGTA